MDHAITVKDVVWPVVGIVVFLGVVGGIFGLIWLFNPFRSGH
jgi:hypothetical protein